MYHIVDITQESFIPSFRDTSLKEGVVTCNGCNEVLGKWLQEAVPLFKFEDRSQARQARPDELLNRTTMMVPVPSTEKGGHSADYAPGATEPGDENRKAEVFPECEKG